MDDKMRADALVKIDELRRTLHITLLELRKNNKPTHTVETYRIIKELNQLQQEVNGPVMFNTLGISVGVTQ